jgi:hypothetical protein
MTFLYKLVKRFTAQLASQAHKAPPSVSQHERIEACQPTYPTSTRKQTHQLFRLNKNKREQRSKKPRWIKEWKRYLRSDAWRLIRYIVLTDNPVCQNCRKVPSKAVRIQSYAAWYSNPTFLEPTEDDLQAVCVDCNKELNNPSDWDDPYNPFYPVRQRKKKFEARAKPEGNQLELFEKSPQIDQIKS